MHLCHLNLKQMGMSKLHFAALVMCWSDFLTKNIHHQTSGFVQHLGSVFMDDSTRRDNLNVFVKNQFQHGSPSGLD